MVKCKKCGAKAIINLKAFKLSLCKDCYPNWFEERLKRTIRKHHLFKDGDRILVAVSGGKDSLSLWYALNRLGYIADGLYINLGISEGNYSSISREKCEKMSEKLGMELIVVDMKEETGLSIPETKDLRSKCSTCGMVKRYFMNRIALERGYTVIATGHNLDDECASLLSTVLRWELGYLGRQDISLPQMEGFVRKVKPFAFFSEKEVLVYALTNKIDYIYDECPYSRSATSIVYKEVLNRIENRSPGAKLRFYSEFLKKKGNFEHFREIEELKRCSLCGQPTTRDICAFCKEFRVKRGTG